MKNTVSDGQIESSGVFSLSRSQNINIIDRDTQVSLLNTLWVCVCGGGAGGCWLCHQAFFLEIIIPKNKT